MADKHHQRMKDKREKTFVWWCALIVLLSVTGGCCSLGKQPVAENVVAAREMSARALVALQQQNDEEAEKLLRQSIATCAVDERARRTYADLLWKRGEYAQAVRQMEEAVRLSAGDAELLVQLGQMQLARGEIDKARGLAERAITADNQSALAWALLGDVQHAKHENEAALASYHRALSHKNFYPPVQLAIAEMYRAANKPQRAVATLAALEEHYPPGHAPAELLVAQGLALKQLHRYEEAGRAFSTAITKGATQPDVYCELAEVEMRSGDSANARLSLNAALEQSPRHPRTAQLMQALNGPPANTAWR